MEHCIEKLKDLCIEYPECPELLWRMGKAHYNIATSSNDANIKLKYLDKGTHPCFTLDCCFYPRCLKILNTFKFILATITLLNVGIEACESAMSSDPDSANCHKWYAILIGSKSELLPLKEKIVSGYVFKEHVDQAIRLNPSDSDLRHLLGRFSYEIASLKW